MRHKVFLIIKDESERVKRKNFREIDGVPLHEYYIRQRNAFDVYIDTDSEEILDIYNKNPSFPNVVAYERRQEHIEIENSGIDSPAPLMIERFLTERVEREEEPIITSHITSPFLTNQSILNAINLMNQYDSVSSVGEIQEFVVEHSGHNPRPINFSYDKIVKTQSLKAVAVLNGAFFVLKKNVFSTNGLQRISNNHFYQSITSREALDIDTEFDLTIAQMLAKAE